jgi:hypothetical protein
VAIDLDNLSSLSGDAGATLPVQLLAADNGRVADARQISPRFWATTFVLVDIVALLWLWVPAFNIAHILGRYWALDMARQMLALGLVALIYALARAGSGVDDATQLFDLRRSARRFAIGLALILAVLAVAQSVPRHSEAHVAIKLCLVALMALLALTAARTGMAWALARKISAGGTYVFQAINVGIGCDPSPPSEIARLTGNYACATRTMRLENVRELGALSRLIADDEVDCIYVSSVWSKAPAVAHYLQVLQRSAGRACALPTHCPLELRPSGELTVRASTTSVGIAFDLSSKWLKHAYDAGLVMMAVSIASA